ncbi:MAG TPA: response regulator, partial [Anaerolineales bacterium]
MDNIQVLVVEDESVVALDICRRLIDMDYGVAAMVSTGEEAIDRAASTGPDLVLMDVKLAGTMSGTEAAEEIQRRFNIPVIYLTAHSDSRTLLQARNTEPYGYCLKPFDETEVRV